MDKWTRQNWSFNLTFASSAAHEPLSTNLPNCDWNDSFVLTRSCRKLKILLAGLCGQGEELCLTQLSGLSEANSESPACTRILC